MLTNRRVSSNVVSSLLKDPLGKKSEAGRPPVSEIDCRESMRSQESNAKNHSKDMLVQSVAVDCKSACLMLATGRAIQHSTARLLSDESSSYTGDGNTSTVIDRASITRLQNSKPNILLRRSWVPSTIWTSSRAFPSGFLHLRTTLLLPQSVFDPTSHQCKLLCSMRNVALV